MDHEVAKTLGELELKLKELERELASIGQRQAETGAPIPPLQSAPLQSTPLMGDSAPLPPSSAPIGRLVDEALEPRAAPESGSTLEQRYSMEARETVYGEIPATKDRHETIDVAELVRFKETMQRTLQGLIDQYSRLLSLEPPSATDEIQR